ncbi:hypothetical protein [Stappia sp.]|uniref:hypothetical protein n=1 Tax=Stappia sp. TaxID=1870903 RepID=UPI003D0CFD68
MMLRRFAACGLLAISGLAPEARADEFFPVFEELQITGRVETGGTEPVSPSEDNYVSLEIQNQMGIGALSGYSVFNCRENDTVWRMLRSLARRENQSAQLTMSIKDYDGNFIVENLPFLHITYTDVRSGDDDKNCISGLISGSVTPIFPVRHNAEFSMTLGMSKTDAVDITMLSGIQNLAAGARDVFGVSGWAGKVLATDASLEMLEDLQRTFNQRLGAQVEAKETFPIDSDDVNTIIRASLLAAPSNDAVFEPVSSVDIRLRYLESLFFDREDVSIGRGSDVLDRPIFAESDKTIRAKLLNANTPLRVHASDIAVDLSDPNANVDLREVCNDLRSSLRSQLKLSRRDTAIAMWSALEEMTGGVRYAAAPHAHSDACFSQAELAQLRLHNETWTLAQPRGDFGNRNVNTQMADLERAVFSGTAADPAVLKSLAVEDEDAFFVRFSGNAFGVTGNALLTGASAFEKAAEVLGTRVARLGCYAPSELSSLGAIAFHASESTDFSKPTANAALFDNEGRLRGIDFSTDVRLIKAIHGFVDWPEKTAERVGSCTRFQITS